MDNIPSSTTGPTGRKPPLSSFIGGGLLVIIGALLLPTPSMIGLGVLLLVVGIIIVIAAVVRVSKGPPKEG